MCKVIDRVRSVEGLSDQFSEPHRVEAEAIEVGRRPLRRVSAGYAEGICGSGICGTGICGRRLVTGDTSADFRHVTWDTSQNGVFEFPTPFSPAL
jgi:hypothetical protein